jgi:hypothetical protein
MSNNNEQDEKKALIENATDLARDAQRRLYPRGLGGGGRYHGPPTTNQGPRRRGSPIW